MSRRTSGRNGTRLIRRSLHDEVVPLLRDMIIDGKLKPGQKIHELELCENIGISRTPLREALKVLAAEGLLQLLPRKGAVVATLTDDEIDELFPIIGALEALAAETACALIDDAGIAEIRALHNRLAAAYERREWLKYSKLNRSIHEAIFTAARNRELSTLYSQLTLRIHSRRYQQHGDDQSWHESLVDHELIIKALEARDGLEIARVMVLHLRHKAKAVRLVTGS